MRNDFYRVAMKVFLAASFPSHASKNGVGRSQLDNLIDSSIKSGSSWTYIATNHLMN